MYFLGIDIGSSSIKLALLDGESGKCLARQQYPPTELEISSPHSGWAEQDPELWWQCVCHAWQQLKSANQFDAGQVSGIGITYQMHGLVLVNADHKVLRPAIIWCDSRAVDIGRDAYNALGADYCLQHLLNSPGNFTAAKLRWVQENEPEIYAQVHKAMLPGDYIAMRLSGVINTTESGLSEALLWDFSERQIATPLLEHWQIDAALIPDCAPQIGVQSTLTAPAAQALGLPEGIPISYRAGDQPNNAFSLQALSPGEVATTAGTSGVIYAVTDNNLADPKSRVNTFLHVNDNAASAQPRNGILLCVNGTGRAYSWVRQILQQSQNSVSYNTLNEFAARAPVGSDGLICYPFGNGAERVLENRNPQAAFQRLDFNQHGTEHMVRATMEGIVFALNYGADVLREIGANCDLVRAGAANLFQSELFTQIYANTTGAYVELYDTDGAEGAARGAALGSGFYASETEAFHGLTQVGDIQPDSATSEHYREYYQQWLNNLSGHTS